MPGEKPRQGHLGRQPQSRRRFETFRHSFACTTPLGCLVASTDSSEISGPAYEEQPETSEMSCEHCENQAPSIGWLRI
jgi:hypothetical protein